MESYTEEVTYFEDADLLPIEPIEEEDEEDESALPKCLQGRKKKKQNGGRKKGQKYVPKIQTTLYRDVQGNRIQEFYGKVVGQDFNPITPDDTQAVINQIRHRIKNSKHGKLVYTCANDFETAVESYWDYIADCWNNGLDVIPDIEGCCSYLGISRNLLLQWQEDDVYGLRDTIDVLRNDIASTKKQLALKGKIPAIVFATDFNNNHGYVQKQEMVVRPSNPYGEGTPIATLREKYLEKIAPILDVPYEEIDTKMDSKIDSMTE